VLRNFDKVLIPEINNGQLVKVIREKYLIPAIAYNKVQGVPFTKSELEEKIKAIY
jgi:2-oxoglutarate ferredoxin oxidoreductase subunit alpha